ncbi:helix-turn-helix domain-containing protein [Holdemanella biformis]|uniref:helix-turn-helix domain-containing protein n=1 Tax=Holdemanella biformis TaxID=1735 RepID=UPI00307B0101
MEEQQKAYYAIIPANVRYDKDLAPNAKLLYGEITALCNEKGYCWASNQYFADLYHSSISAVQKWVSALVKKGYINLELVYKEGTKQVLHRKLYITPGVNIYTTSHKNLYDPGVKNYMTPGVNICVENNKDINNTFNNKKDVYTHKHKYGEYQHVLLTEKEHTHLVELYGSSLDEHIKILDEYIETSGKNYKNHSLVLQKWVHDEWTKRNKNNPVKLDSKFYVQENNQSYEDVHKEMERVRREILGA